MNILPQHEHVTSDTLAVYPERRNLAPKVRAFSDFLVDRFAPVPLWERDLHGVCRDAGYFAAARTMPREP